MTKLLIGIQARTDSTRLPGKAHHRINNRTILGKIIETTRDAIRHLDNNADTKIIACVLTPKDDPIVQQYGQSIEVIEGHPTDVLSRYVDAAKKHGADYIMRLTGDCYWMNTQIISRLAKSALIKRRDLTTNCHFRSFKEGLDCEVLSRRLLEWIDANAKDPEDREHVTTFIAPEKEFPFRDTRGVKSICHVVHSFYEPKVKTSIDTMADLQRAVELEARLRDVIYSAKRNGICVT